MILHVFPTNRLLNNFYIDCDSEVLPNATTIKNFFEEVIIVDNKSKINKMLKEVILWDIINNFEIEKIGFDNTFLRFLENSSFLFNFFNEIESALININDIDISDTYGDYEDHLKIINKIYNAYKNKLDELKLYDNVTSYRLNTTYLKYHNNIEIYIDGLISNKDFNIIKAIANVANVNLIFECSKYNKFIFDRLFGEQFNPNTKYKININENKLTEIKETEIKKPNISLYAFSLRLNQALLVIAKINEWLKNGDENIIIVLPDEDFKKYLQLFDKAKNLNYAMGLEDTNTLAKIENIKENLKIDSSKSKLRNIIENINDVKLNDKLLELNRFENLFEKLDYDDILEFIKQNIKNIDDINGGKVKVVGILETRGMKFDKVIIVDFNDDFLPKINDDDIFLNSTIRKRIKLPTIRDKENLQRHYYTNLIKNANEVCIAFCSNIVHSSLLDELGVDINSAIDGESIWSFFPQNEEKIYIEDKIITNYESKELSVTKIKDFLTCKRKFYFKYIAKLTPSKKEEDNAFTGSIIHDILRVIGSDFRIETFRNEIKKREINLLNRIDLEALLYSIEPFIKENYKILQERKILHSEFEFKTEIFGMKFTGKIDRIDKSKDKIHIIDYKVKKNFNIKDEKYLQLVIYKKAISDIYKDYNIESMYYDVRKNKQYSMDSNSEKKEEEELKEVIKELNGTNIKFDKTQNHSNCYYCDYKYLCNTY